MKQQFILILACMAIAYSASGQNFKGEQKKQEKTIRAAYKNKKITEKEYGKLMDEQELIKQTIEKYEVDGVLDAHEKNVIHDKLERAARRLQRYKTNGEVY